MMMSEKKHFQTDTETPTTRMACPFGDLSCPCPDGLICHYEGPDAWPVPRINGWMLDGESYDDPPVVCVTHRRFVPCRVDDGCMKSSEPNDIDAVRRYQSGEID